MRIYWRWYERVFLLISEEEEKEYE